MRHRGRVIRFFDKGYGFIRPEASGAARLFFHISDVAGEVEPATGDAVTYTLGSDRHWRSKAIEVTLPLFTASLPRCG
jgi:cold shock CspA family protein